MRDSPTDCDAGMIGTQGNAVGDLTWDEVARRIASGAAGIAPVGSAAKEHGLHLPMNTDFLQAEWLADKLASSIGALYWPALSYGYYPAFVNYAGSVSLSAQLFEALIVEVVDELRRFGVASVFVLDTGISTIPAIARAVAGFGRHARVHHLRIHDGPRYRHAHRTLLEQSWGGHADEAETSRMLALAPELVRMARAQPSRPMDPAVPGPLVLADPAAPNFSASGSVGDPTRATCEKGRALLDAMLQDLIETANAALQER